MQYDFFIHDEMSALRLEIEELRKSQDSMRRGLFARHNDLLRTCMALRAELDAVKQVQAKKKKAQLIPFFGQYIEVSQ